MVDAKLLIFSLISLIILIPIIYFLPLNLTKKGKMTVVAASFLIALAGLMTKMYMQLWQSILLLAGLILLLSLVLTKKFSPMLFAVSENTEKEAEEQKESMVSNTAQLETLSEIPTAALQTGHETQESYSKAVTDDESPELGALEELQVLEQNDFIVPDEEQYINPPLEDEAVASMPEMNEHDSLEELEEILFDSQPEVAASIEVLNEEETESEQEAAAATEPLLDDHEDLEALLGRSSTVESEINEEEETVSDDMMDLDALLNVPLHGEREEAPAAMDEDQESTVEQEASELDDSADLEALLSGSILEKQEKVPSTVDEDEALKEEQEVSVLDEAADLEALLSSSLTTEQETVPEEQESKAEEESAPVLDDASDLEAILNHPLTEEETSQATIEELVSIADESIESVLTDSESEFEVLLDEEPEVDSKSDRTEENLEQVSFEESPVFHEASIKDMETDAVFEENEREEIQTAVLNESKEREVSLLEEKDPEENHNVAFFEEQWKQMDSLQENEDTAQESGESENQTITSEEHKKESKHEEIFETLLLQAEIASKMQDEEQLKQIIKRFLNFDEVNDEHYNRLKILLKKYIDII